MLLLPPELRMDKISQKVSTVTSQHYDIEVDQVGRNEWTQILQDFTDTAIYQTWSYGAMRWGETNLSHVVLRKGKEAVAAAQARIVRVPILHCGIAYVTWGPVWRGQSKEKSLDHIRQMVRALREEYVGRRGLYLRVLPSEVDDSAEAGEIRSIFEAEGFHQTSSRYRTLLLDLSLSMQDLRRNLSSRWRRQLNIAENKGLSIIEGTASELYEAFATLYREMLARKKFVPGMDINEFKEIQQDLPAALKMKILVCAFEGEPVAALVGSLLGDTGIYLLGATGDKGLKLRGSYLLHWRMIEWLKEQGARWYDLNGFNPEKNPGTASFKAGVSGKDVRHLGQFDACQNLASFVAITGGEYIRRGTHKWSRILQKMRENFVNQDSGNENAES